MPAKHALAAAIAAALLTGCAVGPDYARPDVLLPTQFHGQGALDQRSVATRADLVDWWKGFGDPQLAQLIELALE